MRIDIDFDDLCYLRFLLNNTVKYCNSELISLKELKKYYLDDDCYVQYNNDVAEFKTYSEIYSKILKDIEKQLEW